MIKRTIGVVVLGLALSAPGIADEASGMPSGKRQHAPAEADAEPKPAQSKVRKQMQDIKNTASDEPSEMNKSELTETLAERPPADSDSQRGKKNKAKREARERAKEVAADHAAVHDSGDGATGQGQDGNKKKDDDVARKTNKSEAARSKKKD